MSTTALVTGGDKIRYTENGLDFATNTTYEEWYAYGKKLSRAYSALQWAIGDWLNFGEAAFGEKYAQALDDLTFAYGTLRNYASVCARIPVRNRDRRLKFHQVKHVACLDPESQARVIEEAVKHKMTGDEIQAAVQRITGKRPPAATITGRVVGCAGRTVSIECDELLYYEAGQEVTLKIKP